MNDLSSIEDHYYKVLSDGHTILKNSTEICDLQFYRTYNLNKSRIQVYKKKLSGSLFDKHKQYCDEFGAYTRIFYNYRDAIRTFFELSKV